MTDPLHREVGCRSISKIGRVRSVLRFRPDGEPGMIGVQFGVSLRVDEPIVWRVCDSMQICRSQVGGILRPFAGLLGLDNAKTTW